MVISENTIKIIIICTSVVFGLGALVAIISTIFHIVTGRRIFSKKEYIKNKKNNFQDVFGDSFKEFFNIVIIAIVARLLLFGLVYLISWIVTDIEPSIQSNFSWFRWDANCYQRIAKYGYQLVGDYKYDIVFPPMYPFLIKIVAFVIRDYVLSAYAVSTISSVVATYFLYLLVKVDHDDKSAYRSVKYFLIFPFSFFLLTPMSESLFMMFLFGALYFARTKKWLIAGLFGFGCTLTRMPGIFVIIPIFIEAVEDITEKIRNNKGFNDTYVSPFKDILHKIVGLCQIPLAFGLYLYINFRVTGDWFKFLEYQKENWHNEAQFFTKTLQTTFECLASPQYSFLQIHGIWIPNLLAFALGLLFLWYGAFKVRPSYIIFLIVYMLFTYSPSWLLSGGRYMIGAFPIFIGCGLLGRNKFVDISLTILSSLMILFFATIYFMFGAMY